MNVDVGTCRIARSADGRAVLKLPEDLIAVIDVEPSGSVGIAKGRNKTCELWKPAELVSEKAQRAGPERLAIRGTSE